jgi:hypothetical protein
VRRFFTISSLGLAVFALANAVSLFVRSDDPYDDPDPMDRYGFPFVFCERMQPLFSGGQYFYYHSDQEWFSSGALWGDVGAGLVACCLPAAVLHLAGARRGGMRPNIGLHWTRR